jgi:RNA polymerase sigma-70 factor (ECF subfamily)
VNRIKSGDISAFDELISRYWKQVYHLAYRMTNSHEDAEDVSQEVFAKVFNAISLWKPKASFYTWLRTVTLNLCIDYHRAKVRRQTQSLDDKDGVIISISADSSYNPLETLETSELNKKILLAANKLSSQQRKAFMLCQYWNLPQKEAAEIMGCAVGTIKAHLSRATAKMRDLLKDLADDWEIKKKD